MTLKRSTIPVLVAAAILLGSATLLNAQQQPPEPVEPATSPETTVTQEDDWDWGWLGLFGLLGLGGLAGLRRHETTGTTAGPRT